MEKLCINIMIHKCKNIILIFLVCQILQIYGDFQSRKIILKDIEKYKRKWFKIKSDEHTEILNKYPY